jgi:DNA-binding NarL/FixJ family response regulator
MKSVGDLEVPRQSAATATIAVLGELSELAQVLLRAGHHVSRVADGASLRVLAAQQSILLVIVEADEHSLGGMNEFDALPSTERRPPVLLVTDDYRASTVVNLTRVGDMVLPAPLAPETLLAAVDLLLTRRDEIARFARNYGLSPRETDLLRHAVLGLNNDEAAAALGCSRGTVATFWHRIFRKTGVSGQRDVMIRLLRASSGSGVFPVARRGS